MAPGRRRGTTDPLIPIDWPRWLVVRDRYSRPVEYRELRPGADLFCTLNAERARRAADGWNVEDIPRNCAFCFADLGPKRVCVSIDCFEPDTAGLGHG